LERKCKAIIPLTKICHAFLKAIPPKYKTTTEKGQTNKEMFIVLQKQ
jgi:hypothetical protein